MYLVAVTACPTGIAMSYMAAARLESTAKDLGHQIKVETQGALGIENELSAADIHQAQTVIFAMDVEIKNPDRFKGANIIRVSLQEAIHDPRAVFAKLTQFSKDLVGVSKR